VKSELVPLGWCEITKSTGEQLIESIGPKI
jgi:hypothetical protein